MLGYLSEVRIGITHLVGAEIDVDGYIRAQNESSFFPVRSVGFIDAAPPIVGRRDVFDVLAPSSTCDTVTIRVTDDQRISHPRTVSCLAIGDSSLPRPFILR